VAIAAGVCASGEVWQVELDALHVAQSGDRIEGGALEIQARNWAATATAVRWSSRTSLECRRTNAELKAKAISRIPP